MKKSLIALLAGVIAAGSVTIPASVSAAYVEIPDYVVAGEITSANYPGSTATLPEVTSGQLLTGKIISAPDVPAEKALALFDGDPSTSSKIVGPTTWIGIELDQAYQLTEFRYVPNPELGAGESGWLWLQGSNDGDSWVNIIIMRQDAHGTDYHIFTPATVTDQRYIDAGYGKRSDESIHWLDNGGSYSIYRIVLTTPGDVEFYGNPAPATELTPEIAATRNISTPYYYPHIIHVRDQAAATSVDGSLVGTIIGGGGVWNKALYERAFDGNDKTYFDPSVLGPECWVGMKFDEPHAITEARFLPKKGAFVDLTYGHFQGSLDGINWVDLAVFSSKDVPSKQEWVIKEITDTKGYTYFRYVSAEQNQSSVAELLLFGAPAEAAEPFTVEPMIATKDYYGGEILYHTEKNVVFDTEISGTPICPLYHRAWLDRDCGFFTVFDGDTTTGYTVAPRSYGSHVWVGLAADEPTVVGQIKMYNPICQNKNIYFQGSNDCKNWTTLAVYNDLADTIPADGWWTADVTDPTAYKFFRLMNDQMEYPDCGMGMEELKIYAATPAAVETEAPETAVPETEVPVVTPEETAAPETVSPETTAPVVTPETTAPETSAPVGTDEPTAPQTFDFGVIAAVTAIVSAAGYTLTKKRK